DPAGRLPLQPVPAEEDHLPDDDGLRAEPGGSGEQGQRIHLRRAEEVGAATKSKKTGSGLRGPVPFCFSGGPYFLSFFFLPFWCFFFPPFLAVFFFPFLCF